jgi:hypothetical protein
MVVEKGSVLTLKAGVMIKPESGYGDLVVNGGLEARGTSSSRIYFTSYKDDSVGGDTNGDATKSNPAPDDWGGVVFNPTSDDSRCVLDYVVVRYGGYWPTTAGDTGIRCIGVSPTISNSIISNTHGSGIYCESGANPTITTNQIMDNSDYGVCNVDSSVKVNATNNWWGDASGPYHKALNPNGRGNAVSDNVIFDPWLKQLPIEPIVDTIPPVITSGPTVSDITSTSAVITWLTDEVSNSVVEYGTTTVYGLLATGADDTNHSVTLTGLLASTTYHYRVGSTDANGNTTRSKDYTFTTTASHVPDEFVLVGSDPDDKLKVDIKQVFASSDAEKLSFKVIAHKPWGKNMFIAVRINSDQDLNTGDPKTGVDYMALVLMENGDVTGDLGAYNQDEENFTPIGDLIDVKCKTNSDICQFSVKLSDIGNPDAVDFDVMVGEDLEFAEVDFAPDEGFYTYRLRETPTVVGNVLLQDDFNNGKMDGWTVGGLQGDWKVNMITASNGVLQQDSNTYDGTEGAEGTYIGTYVYAGDISWTDYDFQVRMHPVDDDGIGVLFRYVDSSNYYRLLWVGDESSAGPFIRLDKIVGEVQTVLKYDNGERTRYDPDNWYTVKVSLSGNQITIYIDDVMWNQVTDADITKGMVGLFCYAQGGAQFDDVLVTSVSPAPVVSDNVLNLDGNGDYAEVSHSASLNITGNITIEAWVKPDVAGASWPMIVTKGTVNTGYLLFFDAGRIHLRLKLSPDTGVVGSTNLAANTWHHVVGVYDGTNAIVYVNGVQDGISKVGSITSTSNTNSLGIGGRESNFFKGQIDEVRIWNVARTQSDVQANMNRKLTGSEAGLVAYYDFDEPVGSTIAHDRTANGNNGTLHGDALFVASTRPTEPVVDTTPPTITSGPTVSDITLTSAVVKWNTDEASSSVVEYGVKPEYGLTAKGEDNVTAHSVSLTSLSSNTTYYYRVGSTDASSNTVWSEQKTFKTLVEVATKRTLSITSVEASPGDKVTISISITDATGLTAGDILVKYDAAVLTVGEVKGTDLISSLNLIVNKDVLGEIKLPMAGTKGIPSGSGAIVEIGLTVSKDAKVGTETILSFSDTEIYDESGAVIPVILENGVVKITQQGIKGDVNNDGKVRSNDAMLALRIAAGLMVPSDYQKWAADMNDDGKIRSNDAMLILRKAAGLAAPGKESIASIGKTITIMLGEAHGVAGERITASLMVDNVYQLASGDICIAYDSAVLRAVEVSSDSEVMLQSNLAETGMIRIAFAGADELNSKTVAKIQFDILADDVSPLTLQQVELYQEDALLVDSQKIDGVFSSWAIPPENSALLQNFPNPFNPETWIPYQLAEGGDVTIRIYNVKGQLIKTLELGYQPAGIYTHRIRAAYWDGKNEEGDRVASGVYFYQLSTGQFSAMRKLILVK